MARFHRTGPGFEIETTEDAELWVNRKPVTTARLSHGDMIEFGVNMAFADPTLSGNRLCDSVVDLYVGSGSEPVIADDNEICVTDSP